MSIADKLRTNLRKVKEGWILFFQDAREQNGKVAKELSEGRILRVLFHTLSGYKSALLRFPYRTWAYLWELKWFIVLYVWIHHPPPEFLTQFSADTQERIFNTAQCLGL